MWIPEFICTAFVVCLFNTDIPPMAGEQFQTKAACERIMIAKANKWYPQGGWSMNCVRRG